jgi:rare lipoprotein A
MRPLVAIAATALFAQGLAACAGTARIAQHPGAAQEGYASYYSDRLAGRSTASGEPYRPERFTAAHRTLPFGTVVRVQRRDSPAEVVVRINDRGPFAGAQRVIDLSRAAAERLGMIRAGVVPVRVEVQRLPRR